MSKLIEKWRRGHPSPMMFVSLGIGTAVAVALIVVVSVLTGGRTSANALVGTKVDTFTLPSLSGGSLTAPYATGHPTVLVFMASYCEPCREELPHLVTFLHDHSTGKVRVIGVDTSDQRTSAIAFIRHDAVPFPVAFDPNSTVAASLHFQGIPDTVFITAQGVVSNVVIGKITPAQFASDLAAINA
ncbi:MAG: TlpA family protein disulfide reductase [Actinomycetales bacterium]|nr:TlpA family protein disulfide reductase [Actinomycetales bacterium]